jgi:hypothetical protein
LIHICFIYDDFLDCGEEGHWSVKDFQLKIRFFEATFGMADKSGKQFKIK